ncbi:MAG: hypothetical protein R6U40_10110 [Desulfobacterales bacterium]
MIDRYESYRLCSLQNRCKSIVCQEDVYLKELVGYIHLNLLRGGLVKKNLRLSGRRIDIKTLAKKVSERYNISIGELQSGG